MFTKIKNFVKSIPTIIKSFLSRCWVRLINLAYGPEIILDEDMAIIDALFSTPFSNTMRGEVLAHSISVLIPTSTKTIIFENTRNLTGEELAQGFRAIPPSITTLYLSGNGLGYKRVEELELAFATIPPSITTLDLSDNGLNCKTGAELDRILKAIPDTVTKIIIGTEITIRSAQIKEARIASAARHYDIITENHLKIGYQISRGLYFCSKSLLARPAGFEKEKIEKAISCLMKTTGKTNEFHMLYNVLKRIGQFLTPVDMAKLTMTCKPLMLQ